MKLGYIYKIVNSINNMIYIGQSVQPNKRWASHRWCANNQEKSTENNTILYNAMRKYGISNFKMEIIEEVNAQNLNEREVFWIKEFNTIYPNGYNMNKGGEGTLGMCEEGRIKISKALSGRVLTKNHIEKMRNSKLGSTLSQEHKDKISSTLKGREFSEEHLEKIRESISDVIIQYDLDGNELKRFIGYKDAVEWINNNTKFSGHRTSIQRCINGKQEKAYGYKWSKIAKRERVSTIENFNKSK